MNWVLFVFLVSPVPILGAMFFFSSNHKDTFISQYNDVRLLLIRWEYRLFHGRLFSLCRFIAAWAIPVLYASLFLGLSTYFHQNIVPKLSSPPLVLYDILLLSLFATFLLAVYTPPYRSSERTSPAWPHDFTIFYPTECTTCHTTKPARSRHCKFCGGCVLLYDHHCIWLNNCVGLGNLCWFYAFLGMNSLVLGWASVLMLPLAWRNYSMEKEFEEEFALGLFCALCFLMVFGFLLLNLKFAQAGMTSNERGKWEVVHELVADGSLYVLGGVHYEYLSHEDVFVSANQYDNRVVHLDRSKVKKVESIDELVNIYDRGSLKSNFVELMTETKYPSVSALMD